jgi:hypothetical protein
MSRGTKSSSTAQSKTADYPFDPFSLQAPRREHYEVVRRAPRKGRVVQLDTGNPALLPTKTIKRKNKTNSA